MRGPWIAQFEPYDGGDQTGSWGETWGIVLMKKYLSGNRVYPELNADAGPMY